jgi:hypothetical protein
VGLLHRRRKRGLETANCTCLLRHFLAKTIVRTAARLLLTAVAVLTPLPDPQVTSVCHPTNRLRHSGTRCGSDRGADEVTGQYKGSSRERISSPDLGTGHDRRMQTAIQLHNFTFVTCRPTDSGRRLHNGGKRCILCLNNAWLHFHAIRTSHNCARNGCRSVESYTGQLISDFHCSCNVSIH